MRYDDEPKRKKHTKKKQRLSDIRYDRLAAAFYWIVKTVLLVIDWFTR